MNDPAAVAPEATPTKAAPRWLPWLGSALAAAPVLIASYPPMTDLPPHEALVALLRTHGDTTKFPPGFLVYNLGHPNQLFHLLAWPLTYLVSPTLAARLMAAVAVAAVPWGAGRLARYLGASPAVSLVAVPLALGWIFNWGFVNNLLGLGLLLALLPVLDRFVRTPSIRGFVLTMAASLVLYDAHELMLFVFVGACGIFTLVSSCGLRGAVVRLSPAALALAGAAVQLRMQAPHMLTATLRVLPTEFIPPWRKILSIPVLLVGGPAGVPKFALFLLWAAAWALFLYAPRVVKGTEALSRRLFVHRFELLAVAVLCLYFGGPRLFNGASLIYQRFLDPAALIGLIALAGGRWASPSPDAATLPDRRPLHMARLAQGVALAIPVATLLVVWPDFADSSRNFDTIDTLEDLIPRGASVASLELDPPDITRYFNVGSTYMRALVKSGGRVMYSFTDSAVAPMRIAPRYQWDEPALRITQDNLMFRPAYDLTRFRFLFLHTRSQFDMDVAAAALAPYAKPVDSSGEWELFESRLDVVPMTTPDQPLPPSPPHTLRFLMNKVRGALEAQEMAKPKN